MDSHDTSQPRSSGKPTGTTQPSPDAHKKKIWLTDLILCASLALLMTISAIISVFLPVGRITGKDMKNFSKQLSSFDGIMFVVDMQRLTKEDHELNKAFDSNGGDFLITENEKGEIEYHSASDEQIQRDVEYKRTVSFGSHLQAMFVGNFLTDVQEEMDKIWTESTEPYTSTDREIPSELRESFKIDEEEAIACAIAVVDLYPEEVAHFNYAGLKRFLSSARSDYLREELTSEKLAEYEKKYLIGTYGDENKLKDFLENHGDDITHLPDYATDFIKSKEGITTLRINVDEESGGNIFGLVFVFEVIITLLAFIELMFAVPQVLRLVRVLRHQRRKVPKRKQNFIERYIPTIASALIIIAVIAMQIVGAVMGAGARLTCTFEPTIILTILVNILIIVADTMYHKHVKQYPDYLAKNAYWLAKNDSKL